MLVFLLLFCPFNCTISKTFPSLLNRIIPSFLSVLIMRKLLYLASELTALLLSVSWKEEQKWVMSWRRVEEGKEGGGESSGGEEAGKSGG